MKGKNYSGITTDTADNLLLGAGAVFKNYDMDTDTFEDAVAAGKLLGATRGGGSFSAIPDKRNVEVDGARGKIKGFEVIDDWEIKLNTNLVEVKKETLQMALAAADIDATGVDYDIITGRINIKDTDYIENITFVGTLSGDVEPIVIQIYNALNSNGLTVNVTDKGESVIALELEAFFDPEELEEPPYAIYYPKRA